MRKVGNLEELLKRLEDSVTKLETENANLRRSDKKEPTTRAVITEAASAEIVHRQEETEKLQQQLQTLKDEFAAEKKAMNKMEYTLWKKENDMKKELSDANLEKRIEERKAKKAEEKIKWLQQEKQKLQETLTTKTKEDEENSKKLLKELDIAKTSLNDVTREASRNKMQADSAQKVHTQNLFIISFYYKSYKCIFTINFILYCEERKLESMKVLEKIVWFFALKFYMYIY